MSISELSSPASVDLALDWKHNSGPLLSNYREERRVGFLLAQSNLPYIDNKKWERWNSGGDVPMLSENMAFSRAIAHKEDLASRSDLANLFKEARALVASDSASKPVGGIMWLLRKRSMRVDAELIGATFALTDGASPENARKLIISPSGLNSFLEVDLNGENASVKETFTLKNKINDDPDDPPFMQYSVDVAPSNYDLAFYNKLLTASKQQ